jgi:hypothetical protein
MTGFLLLTRHPAVDVTTAVNTNGGGALPATESPAAHRIGWWS